MECGLIGLQGVGKTTLFSALTAHSVAVQVGGMKPNVGIAPIPDPRLNKKANIDQLVDQTINRLTNPLTDRSVD